MQTGDRFETNKYGWLTIKHYNNSKQVVVMFDLTGYETTTRAVQIRIGAVKDMMMPSVFGVGYIGDGKYSGSVNSEQTNEYKIWKGMLQRCYSEACQERHPTYIGCTVHPDWHNFQAFAEWCEEHYIDGYEIDKDFTGDGKIYSAETCVFIPQTVNSLFVGGYGDLPLGVSRIKDRYQSSIRIDNKKKHLGTFDAPEEAHAAWKKAKIDRIYDVMANYTIDSRVKVRLQEITEELECDAEWTGI